MFAGVGDRLQSSCDAIILDMLPNVNGFTAQLEDDDSEDGPVGFAYPADEGLELIFVLDYDKFYLFLKNFFLPN